MKQAGRTRIDVLNRRGRQSGLTLIELLIVMGLLTLLATFSLSGMRDLLRSQKVTQASTLVKQYLQNAQIRAITNGRPVAVFLDRISMTGDRSVPQSDPNYDASLPGNYTVVRLQFGEVFPPYVGDLEETFCQLEDSDLNGFADRIVFSSTVGSVNERTKVLSGFGFFQGNSLTEGFLQPRDMIQVEGSSALFEIGDYKSASELDGTGRVVVPLINTMVAPQLPVPGGVVQFRRFKAYRQPTKSMVGSVLLPRGTCVDLALSGLGPSSNGCQNGEFSMSSAPSAGTNPSRADFSRIGVVFDSQGRLSYLLDENTMRSSPRIIQPVSSTLYLLVGRTDQVLPGLRSTHINTALSAAENGEGELPQSNLLDPENVWIVCNPFTGEIKSAPVNSVAADPNNIDETVRQARQSAIAGLTN